MRIRVLQFLLLLVVSMQTPALRACGMSALLFDVGCHPSESAPAAKLVHCDEQILAFGTATDDGGRDACASCEVKPSGIEKADRAAPSAVEAPTIELPTPHALVLATRLRSLPPPLAMPSAPNERILPLLI